ncbi:AraC family transcriptional regulator [Roseateles sp. YR242]|uniref:helix-turn-helix domain-containing protein n=1 Tax=Roseateles sp. YR242 TaxID=1855305 RepID=UPI001C433A7F|nr:helix-turn-helix transcriptional regulator [Roseateles sp. YR242]
MAAPRLGLLGDSFIYACPAMQSDVCRHSATIACAIGPEPLRVTAGGECFTGHMVAVRPFLRRRVDSGGHPIALIDLEPAHPRYNTFSRQAPSDTVQVLDTHQFAGLLTCAKAFAHQRLVGSQLRAAVGLHIADVADSIGPLQPVDAAVLQMMATLRMDPTAGLAALGLRVGLSARRASQAFVAALGLTVRQYALAEKIRRAAMFLGSQRPLTDIAQLCGFADSAHLSKVWQRCYGVCPSQFFAQHHSADGAQVDQAWRRQVSLAAALSGK